MNDRVQRIEQILHERLGAEQVVVQDESAQHAGHAGARGGGGHYAVTVVAARFRNLSALERHRLVYAALGDLLKQDIHALSVKAYSPEEL